MSSNNKLRARRHANPFSIRLPESSIDFTKVFVNPAPLEVEIGPSGGRFLLERARTAPNINIVGLEIRSPMVEKLQERIVRFQLTNAAVFLANANQALSTFFGPGSISRFYAFHPDPWIKNRHLKRRLFNPEFVEAIYQALTPNGEIFAQSDVKFLADEILQHLSAHQGLENMAGEGFAKENAAGIASETELYWLDRGDPVYYMHFRKRPLNTPT
jgi:tRNA (guanine-N7-)-methyltransferase